MSEGQAFVIVGLLALVSLAYLTARGSAVTLGLWAVAALALAIICYIAAIVGATRTKAQTPATFAERLLGKPEAAKPRKVRTSRKLKRHQLRRSRLVRATRALGRAAAGIVPPMRPAAVPDFPGAFAAVAEPLRPVPVRTVTVAPPTEVAPPVPEQPPSRQIAIEPAELIAGERGDITIFAAGAAILVWLGWWTFSGLDIRKLREAIHGS